MKRVLFVTNLFPRPDLPRCGLFNAYFVRSLGRGGRESGELTVESGECVERGEVDVLVPVPEWRLWKHASIRLWNTPDEISGFLSPLISVRYIPVLYIPLIGRSFSWLFYRYAFMRCRNLFDKCDAVLGSWLYPDCVAASIVATACGKPFYARLHGTDRFHLDARFRAGICSRTLNAAKNIFVNAESMREELVGRNICESKISVVRNGVDRDLFHPRSASEVVAAASEFSVDFECLLSESVCTFLWVGNLLDIKAPDIAIKAFASMLTAYKHQREGLGKISKFRLVIVGNGPLRRRLELLAADLGLEDCVIFCGSIPHRDIALWMNVADCLLLTSFSEGMPNVVVESLASGTPVVATDVGDVATVVREGLNGYVVSVGMDETVECLGEALKKVLAQEWNAAEVRESVADFDWQRSAQLLLEKICIKENDDCCIYKRLG